MSKDILSLPTVFNYNLWLNLLLGGILLKDPQDGICGLTDYSGIIAVKVRMYSCLFTHRCEIKRVKFLSKENMVILAQGGEGETKQRE